MKTEGAYVALGSAFSSGLVPRSFLHPILWYQYDKTSGKSRGRTPGILHHVTRSVNNSVQQTGVYIDTNNEDSHLLEVFAIKQYIPASIVLPTYTTVGLISSLPEGYKEKHAHTNNTKNEDVLKFSPYNKSPPYPGTLYLVLCWYGCPRRNLTLLT